MTNHSSAGRTNKGAGAGAPAPGQFERNGAPVFRLEIRPHRSMGKRGVTVIMTLAAAGLSLPLFGLIGTRAAWGMLPFLLLPLAALYWAMRRNHSDAEMYEVLELWPDTILVTRHEPGGDILQWCANPFWVRVTLHGDARIEKYLTLYGNNREIEFGAFLSPWERKQHYSDINHALARLKNI